MIICSPIFLKSNKLFEENIYQIDTKYFLVPPKGSD